MEDNLIGLSREDYFDIHKNPPTCLYLPVTSVCKHVARFFLDVYIFIYKLLSLQIYRIRNLFYKLSGSWLCFVIHS